MSPQSDDSDRAAAPSEESARIPFLRDPSKPLALRLGVVALLFALALYPFLRRTSGPVTEIPQRIDSESFPSGPSGLASGGAGVDQVRAMTQRYQIDTGQKTGESFEEDLEAAIAEEDAAVASEAPTEDKERSKEPRSVGPLSPVLSDIQRPIQALRDSEGNVWLAHLWGVTFLKGGSVEQRKDVLTRAIYDQEFNDDLPPITAIGIDDHGTIWLGLANGQVMRYERYEWQIVEGSKETIRASITSVKAFGKDVYFASKGLFKWDSQFRRMLADPNFRDRRIFDFYTPTPNRLLMGGRHGLWEFQGIENGWKLLWEPLKKDYAVYTTLTEEAQSLLLGTGNGLVSISSRGVVQDRALQSEQITALLPDPQGGHWVATRRGGLKYSNGEDWFLVGAKEGLSDYVSLLYLDDAQELWIGFDQKGIFKAPLTKLRQWMLEHPDESLPEVGPQVFANACDAAAALLTDITSSGDVVVEEIDGQKTVFLSGKQTCPAAPGYRSLDGSIVQLKGWNVFIYRDKERTEITLPETIPADKASVVFLDSRNNVWLGTEGQGVFLVRSETDITPFQDAKELLDNPVTTFAEDAKGRIWIGTVPPYDQANQRFNHHNLHLVTSDGWYHFDPRNGLAHISTQALHVRRDGSLLVGTHAGFSIIDPDGKVVSYGPKEGLNPHFVNSFAVDRKDRIWIAHQYFGDGVSWFDGKNFYRVDEKKGLFNNRIASVAHDRSKRVWVVASNGQVGVYPLSFFKKDPYVEPVKNQPRPRPLVE
ncbi:MAG: hypothetical protein KDD69_14575 [Bdellovibrionales bacterium]|nr:hypothetical protein [Bdellovibrionales bacterium]